MSKVYLILILSLFVNIGFAQKANVDKGCIPLKVNFSSEILSAYYWDFKDGTYANTQFPEHFFTKAGTYVVELRAGKSGAKVGEVTINVYDDPVINIKSDVVKGCAPLTVNFTPELTIDPRIKIKGYKWTFGDGSSDTKMNATYTYANAGLFTVSLEIVTDDINCGKTKIFFDYVDVKGVKGDFNVVADNECLAPYRYTVTNLTPNSAGNTYSWDFGNGTFSSVYNPGKVEYANSGKYKIVLKITNAQGCTTQVTKEINVGKPNFNLSVLDTICLAKSIVLTNNSNGTFFQWQFSQDASIATSTDRNPKVSYASGGNKQIKLSVGNNPLCKVDTVFTIYVEDPSADFLVDPYISCDNPMIVNLEAKNKNYKEYIWNDTITKEGFKTKISIYEASRDSFYMFFLDTVKLSLKIVTHAGCMAEKRDTVIHHVPDAYFYSTPPRGCAPLDVTFTDATFTHVPVKRIKWIFGDGTFDESPNNSVIKHTYTKPGEYLMKMIIENEAGCIDTSARMWVYVGELIQPEYKIDQYEICLGDAIKVDFSNMDPRIDAFHLTTDDGRFNHCWKDRSATHRFITEPGYFLVRATVEYNGCYQDVIDSKSIHVKGAKANIGFMTNCEKPLEVMFKSNSINADRLTWTIEDSTYRVDSFTHTFKKSGDYLVSLSALNQASGCPANVDNQMVKVRQIKANLEIPDSICAHTLINFLGKGSVDVDTECSKGYQWHFSYRRPRETSINFHQDSFPPGSYWIQLIGEDTNGCKDTTSEKHFKVYGISPDVFVSDYDICFPAVVNFKDNSTSDTTIIERLWFNGSKAIDFTETYENYFQQKSIFLILKNAIGCVDSFSAKITGYKPISRIIVAPDKTVCKDVPITFFATDFTQKGSSLDFAWNIGGIDTSKLQTFDYRFPTSGTFPIHLFFTEKLSGCKDSATTEVKVIEKPVAAFVSDADSLPYICHPKIINFKDRSVTDGPVTYNWAFRDNAFSTLQNPSEAFPKGTYTVQLIVTSPYGCADTTTKAYKLVGPEGVIVKNKDVLCPGESITLSIKDTTDVSAFVWKFVDGENISDKSPVTKTFNIDSIVSKLPIELILRSGESSCELIVKDEVRYAPIRANFALKDTVACEGQIFLDNKSIGATTYYWDFGDKASSAAVSPSHLYSILGEKVISLVAINTDCRDTIVQTISLDANPLKIIFPNVFTPNGDMENDFFNISYDKNAKDKVEVVTFRVYDRWGQLLFDNENKNGWDGNYKNVQAPSEVFAYYIELRINNCKTLSKKGNVTLIR